MVDVEALKSAPLVKDKQVIVQELKLIMSALAFLGYVQTLLQRLLPKRDVPHTKLDV